MPSETHINVTVDFSKWNKGRYDIRIPVHQPIKQLLANVVESLNIDIKKASLFAIKVPAKRLLLTDDDRLINHPVTNGDILLVL
ncbi:EsaB/YukD family protein [Heyndrickxia sporothermodurans]|uniref:EsaB/YukD family protein n=1 Tax=Heyndrickxia sporothermodurans TaxID=46224 RepID=UPI002E1E1B81|nr:EsaB/YukD family protein [Heyndrickxia sporothermodurans]